MINSDKSEIYEPDTIYRLRFRNLSFLHSSKYIIFGIDFFHSGRNNHCLHVGLFTIFLKV